MRAFDRLKELLSSERGNVIVICAAVMPLLIGSAAMAVDAIDLSLSKRDLQRAADSAALAGAYALVQSKPVATSVTHDLTFNNKVTQTSTPVIENAPTVGAYAGNNQAVRVVLTSQQRKPFISFFSSTAPTVRVEATAAIVFAGKYCMVSLETGNVTGITFAGSSSVNLGCGVAANSRSANAVSAGGSSTIVASPIAAVGNVPASTSYVQPTVLMPYSPPQTDPFAGLPVPSVPTPCSPELKVQPNSTVTVPTAASGVYCYRGMDIKGTLNLAPGTYYVDGGTAAFGSQANVTGTGVTIILTSSTAATDPASIATISMHGGAIIDLTAPSTGTYAGVLMYQDPRTVAGTTATINGNSASHFEGGFYFPRSDLSFNGNTGLRTECMQLVARRLSFSGNSSVSNTCPANGPHAWDLTFVRLVA